MKDYKVHWLPSREAGLAFCGVSGMDLMYSSSPSAWMVTCLKCLKKGNKK